MSRWDCPHCDDDLRDVHPSPFFALVEHLLDEHPEEEDTVVGVMPVQRESLN